MRCINWFLFLSLIFTLIVLMAGNPTTIDGVLELLNKVLDILSPIGIFIIGYYGLTQWREEILFKKKNKLSEEIALGLLSFIEILDLYRGNWADMYLLNAIKITGDPAIDKNAEKIMQNLNIRFNSKEFQERMINLEKVKNELEWQLKEASVIWNDNEIEKAGKLLFDLFFDFQEAVFRINSKFKDGEWKFDNKELENNKDLLLVYKFKDRIKNRTIDELNSLFDQRLSEAKSEILNRISRYLSPQLHI